MRAVLRFVALVLLIALALSFFNYSSWEDKLLSPDFGSPNMAIGRTTEYPIKGTVAYVNHDELIQINYSKLFMFGCFAGMVILAGTDFLTRNKATK